MVPLLADDMLLLGGCETLTVGALARSPYRLRISLVVISALLLKSEESFNIKARSSGT